MDGNQVKMREALEEAKRFILDVQGFLHGMETTFPGETEIIQKINAALSAPPRNCDVGKDVRTLLEEYIAMLKRMAAKERELIEIALSYGEVGVQQAAIFDGTEEAISALASKINDEMMG